MIPYQLIRRKRDGSAIGPEALAGLFRAYGAGDVPDYQMAAFLMAVYFRGLEPDELDALVDVMLHSGQVVDFGDRVPTCVDKHSTGGVGDKVSLVLAPLVSALGVGVPMMSGRGLGHTGGTLDKLESIPGFRTDLELDAFRAQMESIGCAMIGQTDEIAPLDRRLYALRDVTATVECIPLIASSIMSKKLAEGIHALVLDVKRGAGAFLPELDRALDLARTMIGIGRAHGRDVVALVTAMDRPLGRAVGNALEVRECIDALRGGGPADLRHVTLALAAEMLVLGGAAGDVASARALAETALDDGRALAQMARIIEAQGGDPAVLDDETRLPTAAVTRAVVAERGGVVDHIDARAVGEAAVALGAGRATLDSLIDPGVGFVLQVRPGDEVQTGGLLGTVHASSEADAERGARALAAAMGIEESQTSQPLPLISHRVTVAGVEELHGEV